MLRSTTDYRRWRIILNDDIFQFGQLCIYLIVMTRKDSYIILGGTFTVQ